MLFRDTDLLVALLRFEAGATIDEHAADWDIDVVCLEGSGWTSVDGAPAELRAGQQLRWPRDRQHRLWTTDKTMQTLMLERLSSR